MRNIAKRAILLSLALATPVSGARQLSPLEAYNNNIAEENRDYAQIPHAMLKIQDAAYLGEGDAAALTGRKGQPGSWHWTNKGNAQSQLYVRYKSGKLTATLNGKTVNAAAIVKGLSVDHDVDIVGQSTQVGADINGWRIFVYNQDNPVAKKFTGVSYFPFDPTFRVEARFEADPKLPPRVFRTSRGTDKQFYHGGDAIFTLKGRRVTLPFYTESNNAGQIKDMSAFYTDSLTGKGAYGAGRYVDAADFGKFPPHKFVIDFNQAYNPNCARSAYFTCPIAVDNILLPMAAGERDPHFSR